VTAPAERELLQSEAIVARAVAIVDEGGGEALSLRALARDLGVSAPALYNHIRSKDDLLRLVAGEGYAELARRWTSLDPADHERWIRASCHAYVAFALERPGLFALMFRFRPALIEGPGEIEDAVATAVFAEALVVIERASAAGVLTAAPPLELALGFWAACHGVATVLSMSPDLARERWLVDLVVDGLLTGWKEPR
jgi:AcrR family transcriptional regulator